VAQHEGNSGTEDVSNIGLGPPSSREPLIDIASGPLLHFLLLEKLHQPRPALPYFSQKKVCLYTYEITTSGLFGGPGIEPLLSKLFGPHVGYIEII